MTLCCTTETFASPKADPSPRLTPTSSSIRETRSPWLPQSSLSNWRNKQKLPVITGEPGGGVRFGSKEGQTGLKCDKFGTFSDHISVHLIFKNLELKCTEIWSWKKSRVKMYWNLMWKSPRISQFWAIPDISGVIQAKLVTWGEVISIIGQSDTPTTGISDLGQSLARLTPYEANFRLFNNN